MTDVDEGNRQKLKYEPLIVKFEGKEYDLSSYVKIHPGGEEVLRRNSGKDITEVLLNQPAHKPVFNFIRTKLKTLELKSLPEESEKASKSIVQFVDLLGTTFKPVKADIDGNVNKLNNLFESDSTKYFNLNDIVKIEKTTLSESEFHIGTDALTWLNRALLYNQTFLTFFLKEYKDLPEDVESLDELPEDLNKHFHLAYDLTLKKYHNWFVQKIFGVCLMAAPSRTSLLTYLGYLNSGIQQSNLKQLIIDSIEKYLLLLKANTDAVSILLLSHGIQP